MKGCGRAEPSSKFRDGPANPSPVPTALTNMRGIAFRFQDGTVTSFPAAAGHV
jgi:hypothetical protein